MKHLPPYLALTGLLLAATIRGEEESPSPLPVPNAPSEEDFAALRKTSPFTRVLSLPETYALRGVATLGGERIATLYNRETKKTVVVTPDGDNETGISLVEISRGDQLEEVIAKIAFAGDEAELRYEESQIRPQGQIPGAGPPGGQRGGRPRGPTPEEIERYKALPEDKREKLHQYIQHVRQAYPDMSREERGNLIRGAMMRLSDGHDIAVPSSPSGGPNAAPNPNAAGQNPNAKGNARGGGGGQNRPPGQGGPGGPGGGQRRSGERPQGPQR